VLFLGSVYRAAGIENFAAVRLLQAWMDAASVLLVFGIGSLIFGGWAGRAVGFTAGLAMAQYDFLMLFVARLLSETLYTFLCLIFVILALLALRWGYGATSSALDSGGDPSGPDPGAVGSRLAGSHSVESRLARAVRRLPRGKLAPALTLGAAIALGLANITRPFMIFVLPGYLLWLVLAPRLPRRRAHLVMACLGMLLTVAPVTLRNWQFHQRFILISTNSGFTLYKSLTEAEGLEAPEEIRSEESIDALGLGEVAEQATFRQAALDYMRAHPADVPKIYSRKLRMLWDAKGGHRISHELMVTPDDEWLYHLVLIGALLSWLIRPRFAWHPRLLLTGSIASQYLVSLIANAEVRYRLPIAPLLAILAAWLLWGLVGALVERRGRGSGLAAGAAAP
jgi:hypothetical protein